MSTTKEKTFLQEWLELHQDEEYDDRCTAYIMDVLSNRKVKQIYRRLRDYFGEYMLVKVLDTRSAVDEYGIPISDIHVKAAILEYGKNGFEVCPYPLDFSQDWIMTFVVDRKKFHKELAKGMIFRAKYKAVQDEARLEDLVELILPTLEEVKDSFEEEIRRFGGEHLLAAAKKHFIDDIERVIAERFVRTHQEVRDKLQRTKKRAEEIQAKLAALEQAEKEYENRMETLTVKQREWKEVLEKVDKYVRLEELDEGTEDGKTEWHPWEPEQAVSLLQSLFYYNSPDELVYEKHVIEMFLRGLQTDMLTILTGPSGTGKSSIVAAMAHAIKGARVAFIPVQSSWTDTEDLLGYFNPIDKCFVPSPFLEALARAAQDEKHLHLICLDEMNLAHVEYYFSEFLSVREQKDPFIQLYDKRYFIFAKEFLRNRNEYDPLDEKVLNAVTLLKYPYKFKIPRNVRFVGTLNMDYTVKPLSPKVIDRSIIIEIGHLSKERKEELKSELKADRKTGKIDVSLEQFTAMLHEEEDIKGLAGEIFDLSEKLAAIPNASLNSRGQNQVKAFLRFCPAPGAEQVDQLVLSKLLPRIEVPKREESSLKLLQEFHQSIKYYPLSYEKLTKMLNRERLIRFW